MKPTFRSFPGSKEPNLSAVVRHRRVILALSLWAISLGSGCASEIQAPGGNATCIGGCLIDSVCYASDDPNPDSPCQQCRISDSTTEWTNADGIACDDGSFCNGTETCTAGVCGDNTGDPCAGNPTCNDSCNEATDSCEIDATACLISGTCYANTDEDPANTCHECDVAVSQTQWTSDDSNSCDDGLHCTGVESCSAGVCNASGAPCATNPACNDICNETTDSCDIEATACLIAGTCYVDGDEDPANTCRECDAAVSQTDWTNDDSNSCDDGLHCTGVESCSAGACTSAGDPCTGNPTCNDTCNETTDSCDIEATACLIAGTCHADGDEDPANTCRECDSSVSQTAWTNDDANLCGDGSFCNGAETCAGGACGNSAGDPCTDNATCNNTCNETTDSCDLEATACLIAGSCYVDGDEDPANTCRECDVVVSQTDWTSDDSNSCDDGAFCSGTETCLAGECGSTGNPCPGPDADSDCSETCDENADDCLGYDGDGAVCDLDAVSCTRDICSSGTCSPNAGCAVFVDDDAVGAGTGFNWADAFVTVQEGVDAAAAVAPSMVFVAGGSYTSSDGTAPVITMADGVEIYGSFETTANLLEDRADPPPLDSILDGEGSVPKVVIGASNARLDGFTVTGAYNDRDGLGGGMYNEYVANLQVVNVTFDGNRIDVPGSTVAGAGVYNSASSPAFANVTFSNNIADGARIYGGAMANDNGSSPTLIDVLFNANRAGGNLPPMVYLNTAQGGAISNRNTSNPNLLRVVISNNRSHHRGWGLGPPRGGGMYNEGSHPTLTDVVFNNNRASNWDGQGGGMFNIGANPVLTSVEFISNYAGDAGGFGEGGGMFNENSNPTLIDVSFVNNKVVAYSGQAGGGMYNKSSNPTLASVSFVGNSTSGSYDGYGAGMFNTNGSNVVIDNGTFWGNQTGGAIRAAAGTTLDVSHSDFYGNQQAAIQSDGDAIVVNSSFFANGTDLAGSASYNVSYVCSEQDLSGAGATSSLTVVIDPFEPAADGSALFLDQGSVCIDNGSNAAADFTFGTNVWRALSTSVDGTPDAGNVDMGRHHGDDGLWIDAFMARHDRSAELWIEYFRVDSDSVTWTTHGAADRDCTLTAPGWSYTIPGTSVDDGSVSHTVAGAAVISLSCTDSTGTVTAEATVPHIFEVGSMVTDGSTTSWTTNAVASWTCTVTAPGLSYDVPTTDIASGSVAHNVGSGDGITLECTGPRGDTVRAHAVGPSSGSLRILVLGPGAGQLASDLYGHFSAVGGYSELVVQPTAYASIMLKHYFAWTNRTTRLAELDGSWDFVIMVEDPWSFYGGSQSVFAGVMGLSDLIRSYGATPVLFLSMLHSPTAEEHFWRVAIGTECVPVSVSAVVDSDVNPRIRAGSLYTGLTGNNVKYLSSWPQDPVWQGHGDALVADHVADLSQEHYTGPFVGPVRIEPIALPTTYYYATSGTSSEAGYRTAMAALLAREGQAASGTNVGTCQIVIPGCLNYTTLQQSPYMSLYARGYEYTITGDDIRAAAASPDLQVQVYDRHWDGTPSDGIEALDDISNRTYFGSNPLQDPVWLPMHINFGKLKIATGANLLSDGTHATPAVQAGLAAMSYVSRTGLSPTTAGIDATTAAAISFGEETIRTLSTLSRTGVHIPDTPANRVSIP